MGGQIHSCFDSLEPRILVFGDSVTRYRDEPKGNWQMSEKINLYTSIGFNVKRLTKDNNYRNAKDSP